MTNQVENFIVQYEQETVAKEINANKRILNSFVWVLAAIALLWILTLTNVLNVDKHMITYAFLLSFVLYLPTFYLIHRGKLSQGWIKYFLLALLCVICAIILCVLSYHATLLAVFPLLYAIQYREKKVIRFTFLVSLVTMTAGALIGFTYGISTLNLWLMLLLNIAILLLFSVLMQHTVVSNTRDALRIAQLTYHKDTDTNTKVYNKNKYEEMITTYYPALNRLAVVFFDLNNLKKVNDELGHAMGDYIIETLASIIRSQSNDCRRAYRIGGDEFVMILENPAMGEAELIIAAVKEQLSTHNETGPVAISTAAGFSYGKGDNILEVVKEADEKMYENKAFIKSHHQ